MRNIRIILATLLALSLGAGIASAVDTTAFVKGQTDVVLFTTGLVETDTDGDCVTMWSDGDALNGTCGVDIISELFMARDTLITGFATTLYLAGDAASYECDFQLVVDTVAVGTKLEQDTATVIGTANVSAVQNILVEAGESLEIVVTDGGSGCAGTADPKYVVTIYGYPVD